MTDKKPSPDAETTRCGWCLGVGTPNPDPRAIHWHPDCPARPVSAPPATPARDLPPEIREILRDAAKGGRERLGFLWD